MEEKATEPLPDSELALPNSPRCQAVYCQSESPSAAALQNKAFAASLQEFADKSIHKIQDPPNKSTYKFAQLDDRFHNVLSTGFSF
jgi:hypothetical protein